MGGGLIYLIIIMLTRCYSSIFTMIVLILGMGAMAVAPVKTVQAAACAGTLQFGAMNSELAKALYQDIQGAKTSVAVLPFFPVLAHSQVPPYLPYAFPILLADYWPASTGIKIADWRLTNQVLRNLLGGTRSAVSDAKALDIGEQLRVQYLISGSFDLYQNRIKVYVRYYDVQKKTLIQKANLTVAANLDAAFFRLMGEIAQGASKAFPKMSIDRSVYQTLIQSSARYEALKDFLQGVVATGVYDPDALSVAKVWLKNAIGKDYKFHQAYRELARVHYMAAEIAKQRLIDPSSEYMQAEKYLNQAVQYAGATVRPQDTLARYGQAKVEFAIGLSAFNRSDFAKARTSFEKVRQLTPEDGLNHYYLALAYQSLNTVTLAHEPMAIAIQMNPCFKTAGIGMK